MHTPSLQGDLQLLCLQLDRHVSTHIRESPQAMHWTRLKDLAAQTYIRWQELLAHCQPQVVTPLTPRLGRGGKWSGQLTRASSMSTPTATTELLAGHGWRGQRGWRGGSGDASEDLYHSYQ